MVKVASAGDCVLALCRCCSFSCSFSCSTCFYSEGEVFGWGNSEYGQFYLVTEEQQLSRYCSFWCSYS